jgi:hypothetical protein
MCLIINLFAFTLFSIILNLNGSDASNTWIKNFKNSSLKNNIRNYCNYNNDCQLYGDYNQVCVDHLCECQPNYKWDTTYKKCVYFSCFQSIDCQNYDLNRICLNNRCVCSNPYSEDYMSKKCILKSQTTTTLSPIEKYCYDISYCGLNQFCVNNRCECQPSYEYSYTSNACLFKSCLIENNCQKYDKNTYCNGGSCICSGGYTIDPKTKICNKTVEKSCKTTNDCGSNQFCANNLCECQPNYAYNNLTNSCEYKNCKYDNDCNQFDNRQRCNSYGYCECKTYYAKDPITKFCNVTVGMFCSFNSDCTKYGDNNQVCVDNTCQCIPDYQLDSNDGFCSFQSCYNDYDCQKYDNHRVCEYNRCECDYGYKEDYLSKKCYYSYSYNFWWLWMLFTIPAIIIIVALVRVCKLRNSRLHQSNHSINSSSPILQSNQFIASHSQNVTINDPPPPYSRK